jgi:amino-acid N-acetyltransferase
MIRSARIADVPEIHGLITMFAERGLMLFRSQTELYESIRSFMVYEKGGRVVGCCALDVLWKDMAEVRSLAVDPTCHGDGIGSKLVHAAMEEAHRLGVPKVLSLTYRQAFFERLGFKVVERKALPHKVWTACVTCPKQSCCDEIPMLYESEWPEASASSADRSNTGATQ